MTEVKVCSHFWDITPILGPNTGFQEICPSFFEELCKTENGYCIIYFNSDREFTVQYINGENLLKHNYYVYHNKLDNKFILVTNVSEEMSSKTNLTTELSSISLQKLFTFSCDLSNMPFDKFLEQM